MQPQNDLKVYNLLESSKSQIVRRLAADNRMYGSLTSYSQESLKGLVYGLTGRITEGSCGNC